MFVILKEASTAIWKKKLEWIAKSGGMALLNTHTDYMNFGPKKPGYETYPVGFYIEFLDYIKTKHAGDYYQTLPAEIARSWKKNKGT